MSDVRPLAAEIWEQVFALLQDGAVPVEPFAVQYGGFGLAADQLLPRAGAATYQLRQGAAEAGQWAGQPAIRVQVRRVGNKLEQAVQYAHGWRDVVYDLPSAWQTDAEALLGFRMVSGSAGRNRWFGRRDGKIETRTPARMRQLTEALRHELRRTFAAENPGTDLGLPAQWLTVARLPLATPTRLQADPATKTRLLRQLSQALVVGEVLRYESFGHDEAPPAAPAYYLLGAMHHGGEDQTERFRATGSWKNDAPSRYGEVLARVRPGDRVAIKASFIKGSVSMLRVKARGTVQAAEAAGQVLRVAWDAPFPYFDLPGLGGYQRTAYLLTRPEDIAAIFRPAPAAPPMPAHPLNHILYGPPGTGKTYGTTAWALALLQPGHLSVAELESQYDSPAAMRQAYEQYRQLGQVGFVSFHQSFGYEDFVEGIKPTLADDDTEEDAGSIRYRIEAGIFKTMAERAIYGLYLQRQMRLVSANEIWQSRKVPFSELYNSFVDFLSDELPSSDSGDINFRTRKGHPIILKSILPNGTLRLYHLKGDETSVFPVTRNRLEKLYAIENSSTLTNAEIREAVGKVNSSLYWAVLRRMKDYEEQNFKNYKLNTYKVLELTETEHLRQALDRPELAAGVARAFDFSQLTAEDYAAAPRFVLVIDEINRGNVASIFGELITLLEDDKRGGQPHELRLTLPYSKQSFVVPPNLYVLGTMNTADRSVEALDAALRRRFSFHELAPDPARLPADVAGIDLQQLLRALNERLEQLLDRDHRLGHAWLMQVRDLPGLRAAFGQKIIPQLQEYFYGHWGRIGQVLGAGFVRRKAAATALMPGFADEDGTEEPAPRYEITPPESWTAATFQQLYQ